MIYHSIRCSFKPDAPADKIEALQEMARRMGREIPAVESFCVGRDIGGEFTHGTLYVLKDIAAYRAFFAAAIHRETDIMGIPLVANMVSVDCTDDADPAIAEQIAEIHRTRFEGDQEILDLIQSLQSYTGSGVPEKAE